MRLRRRARRPGRPSAPTALAAIGGRPDCRAPPSRGWPAPGGRPVAVRTREVAEPEVSVNDVPAGVAHDPRGLGCVHEVVRVAAAVDLGQVLQLAIPPGLVPGQPLVLVPVGSPADHTGWLGMPGCCPVPISEVGTGDRDALILACARSWMAEFRWLGRCNEALRSSVALRRRTRLPLSWVGLRSISGRPLHACPQASPPHVP
jgi:hypothetical protein